MTNHATGVAGYYPGGVQWGVKRNDVDPDGPAQPAYYRFKDEAEARDWYESMMQSARLHLPGDQDRWPELVAARIHWKVME